MLPKKLKNPPWQLVARADFLIKNMRQPHFDKEQKRKMRKGFAWIDYSIIENENLSSSAKITYLILSRFANNETQECHPSINTMAKLAGLHPDTVRTAIRDLQREKLIEIDDSVRGEVFYYQLNETTGKNQPLENNDRGRRKEGQGDTENEGINNTNNNNTNNNNAIQGIATPKEENSIKGSQINHIISEFKQLNPSYEQFFNNKTQRKAVENLLKKYGEENLVKLIAKVKETNQIKFAPIIVSPLDLQNKLAKLLFFIKQQEKSGRKIGFTF